MSTRFKASVWFVGILIIAAEFAEARAEGNWKRVSDDGGLTVEERTREGSSLREFRAVGIISAQPEVVQRVLEDVKSYPEFMPYVTEAKTLREEASSRVSYQRISPPMVGDRDYTVRVSHRSDRNEQGKLRARYSWKAANELGPAAKPGVARVQVTEGSWVIEGTDDGRQAKVTYTVLSDGGGGLPAFVTNWASRTAVPKLFSAIRKQAAQEKYRTPAR